MPACISSIEKTKTNFPITPRAANLRRINGTGSATSVEAARAA
jgi:hypothetical protein